jgi:hypothetical protein
MNLLRGAWNFIEDAERALAAASASEPKHSRWAVISRSRRARSSIATGLIELIQYEPVGAKVKARTCAHRAGLDHEVLHPRFEPA